MYINDEENMGVVNNFLSNNKNFILSDITPYLPQSLIKETCKNGYIQTYPNVDGIDGFFVAKLVRIH
jgi:16S rRNA (cytosine967-C5)-methyltransferase